MASNLTSDQLAQANKIYSEIISSLSTAVGTGTWYQPTAGLDQVIYPDAAPSGTTGELYYPFYQVADSYIAYDPSGSTNLAYSAQIEEDPVLSNGSGVVVQGTGFQNLVFQIYGSMVYGLSASDQTELAGYKQDLATMYEYVADQLETSFTNTGDYDIVTSSSNDFFVSTNDGMTIIEDSITYLLTNGSYYQNFFNTGGNMYAKWETYFLNDDGSVNTQAQNDQATVNEFVSWGKDYMMTAGFDLSDELNSSYGPLVTSGRSRAPAWGNPWTASIFSTFSDVSTKVDDNGTEEDLSGITSTAGQAYNNLQSKVNANSNQLKSLITYLSDYTSLTTPGSNSEKVNTGSYNSIVEGFNNAPSYAIPYVSTALSDAQSGNSVSFTLATSGSSDTTSATTSSSTVSWDASASVSGWFWGGSVSNSGSQTSSQSWSSFDDTSENLKVTSDWGSVTAKQIAPASSWFLEDAINQAWSSGITADNADFTGGYAFVSPDQANQFVTASLYYISGIAYGDPVNTISGDTSEESGASESSFESFQQTTTASAGYGWGPYSFGGSTSYSTSSSDSSSSSTFSSSSGSFEIVNNPLEGLDSLSYAGSPSGLIGIELNSVGTAIDAIASSTSSSRSGRGKPNQISQAGGQKSTEDSPFDLSGTHSVFFANRKGKDHITGGSGRDVVYGMGGKDRIHLGSGRDLVWTGTGKHKVTGGKGSDVIHFRKDEVSKDKRTYTKLMDWSDEDGLAFNGYFSDEVLVKGINGGENSTLYLDGEKVAKFIGMGPDVLQGLVDSAHYSVYM